MNHSGNGTGASRCGRNNAATHQIDMKPLASAAVVVFFLAFIYALLDGYNEAVETERKQGVTPTNHYQFGGTNTSTRVLVYDAKVTDEIKEIRWQHKRNCDLSRSAIRAGYMACQLGLSLTNYLSDLERAWQVDLEKRIAEALETEQRGHSAN
ncbi:MAG: hypothetical protein ACTS5I_07555 [Rhodanobacter sp.]